MNLTACSLSTCCAKTVDPFLEEWWDFPLLPFLLQKRHSSTYLWQLQLSHEGWALSENWSLSIIHGGFHGFADFEGLVVFRDAFYGICDSRQRKEEDVWQKGNECPRKKGKHEVKREQRKMIEAVMSGKPVEALMWCCSLKSEESWDAWGRKQKRFPSWLLFQQETMDEEKGQHAQFSEFPAWNICSEVLNDRKEKTHPCPSFSSFRQNRMSNVDGGEISKFATWQFIWSYTNKLEPRSKLRVKTISFHYCVLWREPVFWWDTVLLPIIGLVSWCPLSSRFTDFLFKLAALDSDPR